MGGTYWARPWASKRFSPRSRRTPRNPPLPSSTPLARRPARGGLRLVCRCLPEAAEKLRGGDHNARFPIGSLPPHLPFVTATGILCSAFRPCNHNNRTSTAPDTRERSGLCGPSGASVPASEGPHLSYAQSHARQGEGKGGLQSFGMNSRGALGRFRSAAFL